MVSSGHLPYPSEIWQKILSSSVSSFALELRLSQPSTLKQRHHDARAWVCIWQAPMPSGTELWAQAASAPQTERTRRALCHCPICEAQVDFATEKRGGTNMENTGERRARSVHHSSRGMESGWVPHTALRHLSSVMFRADLLPGVTSRVL